MHLLVIFFITLLVFGPKKLPELGKGIGAGIRALKEGIKDPLIDSGNSASTEPGNLKRKADAPSMERDAGGQDRSADSRH